MERDRQVASEKPDGGGEFTHRQVSDFEALHLQYAARVQHALVLRRRRDDVRLAPASQ